MKQMNGMSLATILVTAGALALGGCSISTSIGGLLEGSSQSVSSPFESSSASSSPQQQKEDEQKAWQRDARDYTAAQLKRSDNLDTYRSGIAKLARKHGITDWEARATTWLGIGEGMAASGLSSTQVQATIEMLAAGNADHASVMQRGYNSAQVAAGNAAAK